jgi:hypothetical protein
MHGTHGTLFCLPGLFVLCAMGYSCAGTFCRYCVIHVYQCHTRVSVLHVRTWYCHEVSGVSVPHIFVLFYIEFSLSSDAAC